MDIIYFLAQIDRLRKERKMKKAEFYEKADVTASAVSQWRNEKTVPAETTIQRIADLFGVEVSFLTGQKEIPPTEKVDGMEEELIQIFRLLPDDLKAGILAQIKAVLVQRGLLPSQSE